MLFRSSDDLTALSETVDSKADQSSVDELQGALDSAIADLSGALGDYVLAADLPDFTSFALSADVDAAVADLQDQVDAKVAQDDFDAFSEDVMVSAAELQDALDAAVEDLTGQLGELSDAVDSKASADDVSALSDTVTELATTVDGKASADDLSALAEVVDSKADQSSVDELQDALDAAVEDLTGSLGDYVLAADLPDFTSFALSADVEIGRAHV